MWIICQFFLEPFPKANKVRDCTAGPTANRKYLKSYTTLDLDVDVEYSTTWWSCLEPLFRVDVRLCESNLKIRGAVWKKCPLRSV